METVKSLALDYQKTGDPELLELIAARIDNLLLKFSWDAIRYYGYQVDQIDEFYQLSYLAMVRFTLGIKESISALGLMTYLFMTVQSVISAHIKKEYKEINGKNRCLNDYSKIGYRQSDYNKYKFTYNNYNSADIYLDSKEILKFVRGATERCVLHELSYHIICLKFWYGMTFVDIAKTLRSTTKKVTKIYKDSIEYIRFWFSADEFER